MRSLLPVLILAFMVFSCRDEKRDEKLSEIRNFVAVHPEIALDSLAKIDVTKLSTDNRHLYDLLSIKANDKANKEFTSDSLILDVINYYSNGTDRSLKSEAYYYGGRVYSELGDYPTALGYFHSALDEMPKDSLGKDFEANIVSQTARLLGKLRLYKEAETYLNRAVEIDKSLEDTLNLCYDLNLLAEDFLLTKNYVEARRIFTEIKELYPSLPKHRIALNEIYLASINFSEEDTLSALNEIRQWLPQMSAYSKNTALAYAIEVYRAIGCYDTVFYYAKEIINNDNPAQKVFAYHILLSPEIRNKIDIDTLLSYQNNYNYLLEKKFDENEAILALNRQNMYNYKFHVAQKEKSERKNIKLKKIVISFSVIIIIVALTGILQRMRNTYLTRELNISIETVKRLKNELSAFPNSEDYSTLPENNVSINKLKEKLQNELMALYKTNTDVKISPIILQSEIYKYLKKLIGDNSCIKNGDEAWKNLESIIKEASPNFYSNLYILTGGKISKEDNLTAMLIKAGFSPKEISVLLSRAINTISTRRKILGEKIFGEKTELKVVDAIIKLL